MAFVVNDRVQEFTSTTGTGTLTLTGSDDLSLPINSSASKYDYMGFIYNSTATKWQLVGKVFGF
jgi:hypothetical protein